MSLEELRKKKESLIIRSSDTIQEMKNIASESKRVANIAEHAPEILEHLDQEFEQATGLQGNDLKFLFAATALQAARIVLINNLTKIESAGSQNQKEKKLHEIQKKLLDKFDSGSSVTDRPYYASMEHIITRPGVPYDATAPLTEKQIERLLKKGQTWDVDIASFIPSEKLSLFKGANHRFSTLGHDPILGLIFGTGNIMSNTITCVKTPLVLGGIQVPVLTTNHVLFTSDYKEPQIGIYGSTTVMLKEVVHRTKEQPSVFLASLIKQLIHIGTDLYTPCGIYIPAANLVLSNTNVETLTKYISTGDIVKIGASTGLAELINTIICTLHTLMYNNTSSINRDAYSVRTRKIILYSNAIATGSNVIWTGANVMAGNTTAIRNLDIGGLLVIVKRLTSDQAFIRQIKEEFVFNSFKDRINDPTDFV